MVKTFDQSVQCVPLNIRTCLWAFCVLYWAAATTAVGLREGSARFRALAGYGGRRAGDEKQPSQEPQGPASAALSVSRRWAFAAFYVVGAVASAACIAALVLCVWLWHVPLCAGAACRTVGEWLLPQPAQGCLATDAAVWRAYATSGFLPGAAWPMASAAVQLFLSRPPMPPVDTPPQLAVAHLVPGPSPFAAFVVAVPVLLFLLHCCVRLVEVVWIQHFRSDGADKVSLFAAVAGGSFYVVAPLSFLVASLELVVRLTELALALAGAVLKQHQKMVASEAAIRTAKNPYEAPPTTVGEAGPTDILLRGGAIAAGIGTIIFVVGAAHILLQAMQVFHHYVLSKLQAQRQHERQRRIDKLRQRTLQERRSSSEAASLNTSAKEGDAGGRPLQRHASISRMLPTRLEPPYVFPAEHGLFSLVLEPHYGLEVAQYVVLILLFACLITFFDSAGPLLVATVDDAADLSGSMACGDFAVLQQSEAAKRVADVTCTWVTEYLPGDVVMCRVVLLNYAAMAARWLTALGPLILVTLFSLLNLNATAREHRRFWVDTTRPVSALPKYNLIPWLL